MLRINNDYFSFNVGWFKGEKFKVFNLCLGEDYPEWVEPGLVLISFQITKFLLELIINHE